METKLKEILDWLEQYKETTRCRGVVLGISGGKDSTVVAMLAKKVFGDNVVGVLMPNGDQIDIEDARTIVHILGIQHFEVNISDTFTSLINSVETQKMKISDKAKTNIAPRLRMTTLYAIAQSIGYRVIGTGNASEAYIGWTTKWGDNAYDLNPIAHLTCTEVIEIGKELAKEFGLDERFVCKAPSDGLTGKTDEENFGFTYEYLDRIIKGTEEPNEAIDLLHKLSEHKRIMPYTYMENANE